MKNIYTLLTLCMLIHNQTHTSQVNLSPYQSIGQQLQNVTSQTNSESNQKLFEVIERGNTKSVQFLLNQYGPGPSDQKKLYVNTKNQQGETPLEVALGTNDVDIVKLLLDAHADLPAKTSDGLLMINKSLKPEIVKLLIAANLDVNAVNKYGQGALDELATIYPLLSKPKYDFGSHIPRTYTISDDQKNILENIYLLLNADVQPRQKFWDTAKKISRNYASR